MAQNACGVEISQGSILFWKDPADNIYKQIGFITEYPQFAFTHGTASCDDDSAEGWATRYKNGKRDAGTATIGYNWVPGDTVQDEMFDVFDSINESAFRMQWSDAGATKLDFGANVTGFNAGTPPPNADDAKNTRSLSIELTGQPAWG